MTNFIDLHAHSTFSSAITAGDAYGTPEAMVHRAVELGWQAVSLTDHGWLGGLPALYQACKASHWSNALGGGKKPKIKPIFGCEMYVTPDFAHGIRGKEVDGMTFHLTVLALSREGYQNLVTWTTEAMQRENFHRKPRISLFKMAEIAPHPLTHNVVLTGCLASELSRLIAESNGAGMGLGISYIEHMKMIFPNFYVEVVDHTIRKFETDAHPAYLEMLAREAEVRETLISLARATNTPLVVTNDSHMPHASDRKAHIALKASGWRNRDDEHMSHSAESVISKYLPDYTYFGNYLRDMEAIVDRGTIPKSALASISDIVQEAEITLEPLEKFSYSIPSSGRDDPVAAIRRRCKRRLSEVCDAHGPEGRTRFEHELESMADFADYLLLMSDFIIEAKRQGILTWTRGSAANSLIAYCLEIHEIDPMPDAYDLLFSRFFNPARKKLPDIDLDIQPSRYEDFMQIVHTIMEPLVGKGQVVQISNWGTAANRRAFRMAASALGMPKEEQDEIAKLLPQMIDSGMVDEDTDVLMALREDYPELYELASGIFDSIQNVSQHACAWLFGTPDRPVEEWIPLYLIASSGTLVTQYDFKTTEDFGLTKMDFLRLKSLDIAANALRAAGKSPLEFHNLPVDDPDTLEMIAQGSVDGVHTVQGKEVRRGCMEIEVESVHDVILAAALYRPANTRENQDKLYVERRKGFEIVEYPHPIVEEILGPTFGIPVYQEQAMEICYAIGSTDEFVDDVYQAIKKAKGAGRGAKEMFAALENKFTTLARKTLKVNQATALKIWQYVKAFQGYGFNKGHATSYGILAAKSAYLKCHHPAEFYAALLDVFPERPTYLAAARAEGFKFLPPDINRSSRGFATDKLVDYGIRVGISKVLHVGPTGASAISLAQPFQTFDDFRERVPRRAVNARAVESLQRVGALQPLGLKADTDPDTTQFELLGFTLEKPKIFRGVNPKQTGARQSTTGWKHLGRYKGVENTDSRSSVSKLFWLPPYAQIETDKKKFLELKASPWAQVKTYLLTVVDENGLPFHLMVNEDKPQEVRLVKFLHDRCQNTVVCLDGMIRLPFVNNGPSGFRLFGVTGSYNNDPQMFGLPAKDAKNFKIAVSELDRLKRVGRYA
jgi:DNA polymerase-3 subunit alpha